MDAALINDLELRLLLEAIYLRFHYDFRQYSRASLERRIARASAALGCETTSALQERVLHDPAAFSRLLQFLTVQVSDMFRDPSYFRTFRERIVPFLKTYPSLKLWVAGCATGEEAYSFAITLLEENLLDRTIIYATDINPAGLREAEDGVYSLDRIGLFTENHRLSGAPCSLSKYYTARYDAAVFDRALRKQIVFSDHSLATDTAFAEVQLVSCRNVLIYFDLSLQNRAVRVFSEALCRKGFLGLGSKESLRLSEHRPLFTEFSAEDRWYQKQ
jgi:chemotaxis protein methyltransferase CheR